MSKKTSSVSAIDHFFHQRKDTFQTIGHYGLFWIRITWFLFWALLLIIVPLMIVTGVPGALIAGTVSLVGSLYAINFVVAVFILSRLFRRYAKGDVFSMKNTGFLVALGTFQFIFLEAPVLGTLLLAVAVVVPSRDVDTPKADA